MKYYAAPSTEEGLTCFGHIEADGSNVVGCGDAQVLDREGAIHSFANGDGTLTVRAYVPEGFSEVRSGASVVSIENRLLSIRIPANTTSLTLAKDDGALMTLKVPGTS